MAISTHSRPRATLVLQTSEGEEMSMVMDTVSAEAAGAALGFPSAILAQLRSRTLIAGDGDQIDLDDAARVVDEIMRVVRPLAGTPILISRAAEKYGFSRVTIHNWISAGWVKVLIPEPRRRIDEGDIVLAKAIANIKGYVPGQEVFPSRNRTGRPRKN
jgi:hypothetical protein